MNASRITVNSAVMSRGVSGSATATNQLITALREIPGVDVEAVAPPWERRASNPFINAGRDAWWDLRGAARAANSPDLLISPCNIGMTPKRIRHLLVVYDVMVFENPEYFDKKFAYYFKTLVPSSLRRADRILTLSNHAREYLLGVAPQADIRVMTLPGRGTPLPLARPGVRRCVLMIGGTEPHKNHKSGVQAVAALRESSKEDIGLRIIGPEGRAEDEVIRTCTRFDPGRAWISRERSVSDQEIDAAYGSAWVLLQPSFNEGYGLPLVEAAERGLPVVHSGGGAMKEVMPQGNVRSVYPQALAQGMEELLSADEWERRSRQIQLDSIRFRRKEFPGQLARLLDGLLPATGTRREGRMA